MTTPNMDAAHTANPLGAAPGLPDPGQVQQVAAEPDITTSTARSRLEAAMTDPGAVLRGENITVAQSADSFSRYRGVQNPYGTGLKAYEPNTVLLDDYTKSYDAVQNSKAADAAKAQADAANTITVPGVSAPDPGASGVGYAAGGLYNANGQVSAMVQAALTLASRKVPYVWGGTTAQGVDCSGLVYYAAQAAGIKGVKRYRAVDYGKMGTAVSAKDARPGDIVFYDEGQGNGHVGIYLGNGMMVAAPQSGEDVKVQAVYGTPTSIRRIFNDDSFASSATPSGGTTYSYNGTSYNPTMTYPTAQANLAGGGQIRR